MSDPISLPPIYVYATEPGYPQPPGGLPYPAPNPAYIFGYQQQQRNQSYGQGMWREMMIKVLDEQSTYVRNGVVTVVTEAFARDMQAMPLADAYMAADRSRSAQAALNYAQTNYKPGDVPRSSDISGGILSPVAAMGHFVYGGGKAVVTDINSLLLRPSQTTIPALEAALAAAPVGTTSVSLDKVPYNTADDYWITAAWLGNITLKIEGSVTKGSDGSIVFTGTARAYNDIYDANKGSWRGWLGETLTAVLAGVQQTLNAQPYEVQIQGTLGIDIKR